MVKQFLKISSVFLGISLALMACHPSSGTKAPTDSLNTDSAKRDVTQSDTDKADTNKNGVGHMQGDGHPRGGLE